MSYTPGPWKVFQHPNPECSCLSVGEKHDDFPSAFASIYLNGPDNARLIAAAPELVEALQNMVALWERVHGTAILGRPTVNAAKKALAKAVRP